MANIFDYLDWRGDIPLEQVPFNDVDALVLSRFSFLPFDNIVPESFTESISLLDAVDAFLKLENASELAHMKGDITLAEKMRDSQRFNAMRLSGFVNHVDKKEEKQFSAIVINMESADSQQQDCFISFRGTDNNLVGWKEDFNMCFMPLIPAQKEAVEYLKAAAVHAPGLLRLGGHSKGGNLAVYAAAFAPEDIHKRILKIYNNDGPGFHAEVLESSGYKKIHPLIRTFIPQSSVVGLMLEHQEQYVIIRSTSLGLFQHDIYSWQIMGGDFIRLDTITNGSRFIDETLKTWVAEMSPEQRSNFIDALYAVITASGAETVTELGSKWYAHALAVTKTLFTMDDEMREAIGIALKILAGAAKRNWNIIKPQFFE